MPRLIPALRRDERGASLVELALMAPILLAFLAGIVDCARLYAAKLSMQQAAERSVEIATAGGISAASDQALQTIKTNMQNDATSAAPAASQVTASLWLECAGVKQNDFNTACNTGDQVARYAAVSITGSYRPAFPYLFGSLVSNGRIAVRGAASVRVQ